MHDDGMSKLEIEHERSKTLRRLKRVDSVELCETDLGRICSHILNFSFRKFYWRTLYDDADNFVKCCVVCQRTDRTLKKTAALPPIHVESTFWRRIGVDLIGPLVESSRGNKYIMTCTDAFTKWQV